MTGFIPRFAFWNPSTWAIPTLYWDTFSQEQRIHAICRQLGKVINYADMLGVNVDDIADRLKAIEEGQLDEYIVAAIETWFNENEPYIVEALASLNDALPIDQFDSEHTVKDSFDSLTQTVSDIGEDLSQFKETTNDAIADLSDTTNQALESLEDDLSAANDAIEANSDNIASILREKLAFSATPIHEGIVRIDTNAFSSSSAPTWYWAQGTCVNGSDIYILLCGASGEQKTGLYRKTMGVDSVAYVKELNAYHGADIIFIPEINEYWISKGSDGVIFRYDTYFNQINSFTIGSSANCLAYDKVTGKVYVNVYWGELYEVDPQTREIIREIDMQINADGAKQSICAHNDVLYVLYSDQSNIEAYDLVELRRLGKIDVNDANIWSYYMGETEGIDTDENGNFVFTSHYATRDASIHQNHIWMIDFIDHSHENANRYIYQRDIVVDAHTPENMLTHQNPTGFADNAFVTLDEALAFVYKHPHIARITLKGNHTMEQPSITLPNICIEGDTNTPATLGRLVVTNGCLEIANVTFNPQISTQDFIGGYRNGCMVVFSNVTKASGATPSSGYDIRQQGVLCHKNTLKTGNANFSD